MSDTTLFYTPPSRFSSSGSPGAPYRAPGVYHTPERLYSPGSPGTPGTPRKSPRKSVRTSVRKSGARRVLKRPHKTLSGKASPKAPKSPKSKKESPKSPKSKKESPKSPKKTDLPIRGSKQRALIADHVRETDLLEAQLKNAIDTNQSPKVIDSKRQRLANGLASLLKILYERVKGALIYLVSEKPEFEMSEETQEMLYLFVQKLMVGMFYCSVYLIKALAMISWEMLKLVGRVIWWLYNSRAEVVEEFAEQPDVEIYAEEPVPRIRKRTSALARLLMEAGQDVPVGLMRGQVFKRGLMFGK